MSDKKSVEKFHFIANPSDKKSVELKEKMIAQYGQSAQKKAPTICVIGGDGSLIYALRDAFHKAVIGQCRNDSNSVGFWMNRVNSEANDLEAMIQSAHRYVLKPLRIDILHKDNTRAIKYAFTDAAVMSNNGQASLLHLKDLDFEGNDQRIMGNGLTFATPFGSTAKAYAEGGSALDLTLPAFILTGSAVCSPLNFKSFIYPEDAKLLVEVNPENVKRDQRIDIDGVTYIPPKGTSVASFEITTDQDKNATLLIDRPARSAFKALTREL
jgi:NAD kinase